MYSSFGPLSKRQDGKQRQRFQPGLEMLEGRILMAAGVLDPSFGVGGKLLTGFAGIANDVVIQADGKIVAVGQTTDSGDSDFNVMRFNADGSPDATFGNG